MLRVITTRNIYLFCDEYNKKKALESIIGENEFGRTPTLIDDEGKSVVIFLDKIVSIEF